jgi:16S rRNA (cytidine1402-2'-O)-methyltransferase
LNKGKLYLIPTPIGNLKDITLRALDELKRISIIACEDTRVTGKLLKLLEIESKRLIAYHDKNEINSANGILQLLQSGEDVALTTDAGYPCISDPGYRIVRLAHENDVKVVPLPGASSVISALAASGLETDSFQFFGFAPAKKGRQTFLKNALNSSSTIILLESVHKIIRLLEFLHENIPNRYISVCKEMTKLHESITFGKPDTCRKYLLENNGVKGEFVVIIERKKK